MAKIQSSRAKIYETKANFVDEPTDHVESAGEKLIKQMVQKQLNTRTTLQEQLRQSKDFQSSTEVVPLSVYTSGQVSLQDFQHSAEKAARIEELKSFGLTADEIELFMDFESGEQELLEKYKKIETSSLSKRLLSIHAKIENGKKCLEDSQEKRKSALMSRHEQELGLCVKPDSEHTKLLKFALSCQPAPVDERPSTHPINQLKDIADNLFGRVTKKKRRLKKESSSEVPAKLVKNTEVTTSNPVRECGSSLWDVREKEQAPAPQAAKENPDVARVYSCEPEKLYTIKNKKIVPVQKGLPQESSNHNNADNRNKCQGEAFVVPTIASSPATDLSNKLSVDEIKSLPRFKNYEEGTPSKVLYLKNLANRVDEEDLADVFSQFEEPNEPRINYRLMGGKMKGQAFVTLSNASVEMLAAAEPTVETDVCPECLKQGINSRLKIFQVSFFHALWQCENMDCSYPFFENGPFSMPFMRDFRNMNDSLTFPQVFYGPYPHDAFKMLKKQPLDIMKDLCDTSENEISSNFLEENPNKFSDIQSHTENAFEDIDKILEEISGKDEIDNIVQEINSKDDMVENEGQENVEESLFSMLNNLDISEGTASCGDNGKQSKSNISEETTSCVDYGKQSKKPEETASSVDNGKGSKNNELDVPSESFKPFDFNDIRPKRKPRRKSKRNDYF